MSITLQKIVDILRKLPTENRESLLGRLAELADPDVDLPRCPSCGRVPEARRLPHSFEIACENASCAFSLQTKDTSLELAEDEWFQAVLARWEGDLLLAKVDRDLKADRRLAEKSPGGAP